MGGGRRDGGRGGEREKERERERNSNSKILVLKDSSVSRDSRERVANF